ncbi:unnamed protein product [Clonostachys rosea]|uniref:Cell wall galactomannoprotein n=1 Tax=Bionectria ochroleuca TaxID=29856 RepID=A0ABY6V297_BIOOC|nr:unnamed protein product [Clonostachys rosea]
MRFTKFFAGVTFALSATQAQALVSPGEIAETFESLTNVASDIIQTVATLDSGKIITAVPRIVGQFGQIAEDVVDAFNVIGNPDQYKDLGKSDQDKICDALENFVDKARDAVDSIIGKDSIIGRTPFVDIVAQVLKIAADGIEQLARSAIKIVPGCKERIENKLDNLQGSFNQGISNFRAIAVEQGEAIPVPTPRATITPTLPSILPTSILPEITGKPLPKPFQA